MKKTPVPAAKRRHLDRMSVGRSAWGLYRETRRPGAPGLVRRVASAPFLVKDVTFGRYRGVTRARLFGFFLLMALYVVSPIDAIPDFIPVLAGPTTPRWCSGS
ncbi:YkvA family protein [Streptacidiphilus sp. PAMC 29251]